jgi:hypothetical protein
VFRFANRIVANADAVRDDVIAGGTPARKVVTVYNGLDFGRLAMQTTDRVKPNGRCSKRGGRAAWLQMKLLVKMV